METELTAFDMKFLTDCGIAANIGSDTKTQRVEEKAETDAIYYRRIVEELG